MYTLTSYCKVHASLCIQVKFRYMCTNLMSLEMYREVGLGVVLDWRVCNTIGHQEVVLWADPPSSYHQLVEKWGYRRLHLCGCVLMYIYIQVSVDTCTCMKAYQDNSSWFLGAVGGCTSMSCGSIHPPGPTSFALGCVLSSFCIILLSSQPYMSSSSTYSSPPAHKASG